MPVEPGSARTRSSIRVPREAPAEVVRQVWAVVASARQVHSCRVAVEARSLTRSNIRRCIRAMSTEEEGRSRTARHELLKMVPNTDDAAALMLACFEFPCAKRGNAPSRAPLTHAPLMPMRLISSPILLSLLVRRSAPVLLLGMWSLPASPGDALPVVTADIARASPFSRSFKSSVSVSIAYKRTSSGKLEVKLPSTVRLISRAGVVT